MGSSSSKIARSATKRELPTATKRKLPTTSSTLNRQSPVTPAKTTPPSSDSSAPPLPTTAPQNSGPTPGPTVQPSPSSASGQPAFNKNEFIDLDARDPTFSSRLQAIGPVKPAPTASNTSTFSAKHRASQASPRSREDWGGQVFPDAAKNPALIVIQAREKATKRAEQEKEAMGRKGFEGRTLVDAATLSAIVRARGKATTDEEIERRWRLKKGILQEKLGKKASVIRDVTGGT